MKKNYRKKYRNIRKNISNKKIKDKLIYEKVIHNELINNSNLMLIYVSTKEEVDTIDIIKYFIGKKQIAVPKIVNEEMDFYYIESLDELKEGYFNILEPTTNKKVNNYHNSISITPGICFSKDNYRLGYGKGYYDKFYNNHNNIYRIGITYKELLLDRIPYDKFDIKMNEIITD